VQNKLFQSVQLLKQKYVSAPQLLHCAHNSSVAWNVCQVVSVVKGVNDCRIMLCRTVQQAGGGIYNHYYLPSNWTAGHSTDSVCRS